MTTVNENGESIREIKFASAQIIRHYATDTSSASDSVNLKHYRDRFMKELFAVLLD